MKQIYIIMCVLLCSMNAAGQNDRDYIRRGNRLAKDTLFSKAQVQYQKAIEFDNTNPQAHYNLGNALLFQNKAEDAMKEYDSAVKFERNKERKAKMYHNMGVVLQSAKQFDKALACYQNALRNDPTNGRQRQSRPGAERERTGRKERTRQAGAAEAGTAKRTEGRAEASARPDEQGECRADAEGCHAGRKGYAGQDSACPAAAQPETTSETMVNTDSE